MGKAVALLACFAVGLVWPPLGAIGILFFLAKWYLSYRSRLIAEKGLDIFTDPSTGWTTVARVGDDGEPLDLDKNGDPIDIDDLPPTSSSSPR